jgi:hypothetical protein
MFLMACDNCVYLLGELPNAATICVAELSSQFILCSYDVVVDVMPEVKWTSPDAYKNLKVVVEFDDESSYKKAAETELQGARFASDC